MTDQELEAMLRTHPTDQKKLANMEEEIKAIMAPNAATVVKTVGSKESHLSDPTLQKTERIMNLREKYWVLSLKVQLVRVMVGLLPPEERRVVEQRCFKKHTMTSIAARMPISRRTVYNRWHSALAKMHRFVEKGPILSWEELLSRFEPSDWP